MGWKAIHLTSSTPTEKVKKLVLCTVPEGNCVKRDCVCASSWRQTAWLPQRDLFWLDSTTLSPSDLWHLISLRPHLLCSLGNNIPQINNKPAPQALSSVDRCVPIRAHAAPLCDKQEANVLLYSYCSILSQLLRWELCQTFCVNKKDFQVFCVVKFHQ